jgi:hypothetical protein
LGFKTTSSKLRHILEKTLQEMIHRGAVEVRDEKLFVGTAEIQAGGSNTKGTA